MKQRIVTATIMIYQGVISLLRPHMAARGMAQGICLTVAIAVLGLLIDAIKRKDCRTVVLSILAIAAAAFVYFKPNTFAGSMRYLITLSVLSVGLVNLFQAMHVGKALALHESVKQKLYQAASHSAVTENVQNTIEAEVEKRLLDTKRLIDLAARGKYAARITGILMTGIGILLLIYSVEGNIAMTIVSAISMILIGAVNLVTGIGIRAKKRKT